MILADQGSTPSKAGSLLRRYCPTLFCRAVDAHWGKFHCGLQRSCKLVALAADDQAGIFIGVRYSKRDRLARDYMGADHVARNDTMLVAVQIRVRAQMFVSRCARQILLNGVFLVGGAGHSISGSSLHVCITIGDPR